MNQLASAPEPRSPSSNRPLAVRLTLIYILTASVVVVLSDLVVRYVSANQAAYEPVDLLRAALFVGGTSLLIFGLLQGNLRLRTALDSRHALFENASDIVFTLDLDGRFTSINSAVETILGYAPRDLLGKTLTALSPVMADQLEKFHELPASGAAPIRYELALSARDGRSVYLEINCQRLLHRGRPIGIYGVARDITEQHQAQTALRDSEQRYRDLFDNIPLGVYRTTPDGRVLAANPALIQMLGYTSLAEFQQRDLEAESLEAHYPRQEFRDRMDRDGYVTGREAEWLRRDGTSIFVRENARATRAPDGTVQYHDGIVEDFTERRQIELALERERDVLRALLNNTVDTIYFKDAASRFTRINRAQAQTLGVADPQDAIGKTDLDFFPPELAALMWTEERQLIETGRPVLNREEFNPTRDGRPRWFSVSKTPLFDQAGQVIGLVGVSRDITAVKLREREFQALSIQNAQLLAAEREQRALAEALRDMAAALNSTLNVDEVLDRVLANIERVAPHDTANIMLINSAAGQLEARVARCHGYERISPELNVAVRQLRLPVMTLANLRQMMDSGQPCIIADIKTDPDWVKTPSTNWQRSYIGAPIKLRDSVIGFIQLDSRQPNFFTATHAERLQTFANQTAIAIENARLYEAEREQFALAEALRDTANLLNSTLNFDEVIDRILSNVGLIVPNDTATLLQIEQGIARMVRAVGYQDPTREALIRRLRLPIETTPNLRYVVETGKPYLIADIRDHPEWVKFPGIDWIQSNVAAPITIKGQVVGVLTLDSAMPNFYTPLHAERLHIFAAQAAVAVENAQLFAESQGRLKELAVLFDGSRAINATLDRATVMRTVTQRLADAVDATSVYILSVDLAQSVVHMLAEYFSPDANDLERVSDLGATYSLDDIPDVLAALRRGQPSITRIDDPEAEPFAVTQLQQYGSQSSLRVPMIVAGQVRSYAVIWDSRLPRRWTESEIQLCQTLANQAASALENVRLLEETRQGLKEQSALLAASMALSSSLDLLTVLQRLAEQMGRAIDATSVYVCEWNRADNTSKVVVDYYGSDASEQERISDVGVAYDLAIDYGANLIWQQPGGRLITHVDDPDVLPQRAAHLRQYGCQSVLTVGLIARANVFGYIELWETRRHREFTPAEIMLCQAIAQQAAVAFENARLFEAERKQLRLAQTLQAVGALLTAQMSLNEVFEYIFDLLARAVAYDSVSVQLIEEDRLALTAGRGFPNPDTMRSVVSNVSKLTLKERWGAAHQRTIILPDTHADPRWIVYPGSEHIRSWIGAALRVKGRLLGILNVDSTTPGAYTEELGETVAAFANQAAIAIENAQLTEAVRRHADELEERVIERTIELEHERKRTAAILDTAGEGIFFTDAAGTIEYMNQAMERLTGYEASEALGQNPRLWKSGQTSPALYHEMWDTIKRGRIWQGELVNRRKDGTLYDAALTIAPLHPAAGSPAGFVGVQHDITQRKELERLKDEFVSNVSHELRTPIANVKLYISLLTRGKPERRDDYLETLRRESARLEKLIENLLDLSRLDLGTTKVEPIPIDLNQLTAQLSADRTALASGREHTIDYHAEDQQVIALADAAALGQVFTNLMTNAINYTPPGGLIVVSVAYRQQEGQRWATFTVKDTGPGISAADLPHLFDRFYRGEVGRKSGAPGTGLGLAISDKIISRLGGQITVDSQPGHGSAFTVWLKTP